MTEDRPTALCCCGTPLVSTLERSGYEWYCITCKAYKEWLHARKGAAPNPSPELDARLEAAQRQYDEERQARRAAAAQS